MAALLARAQSTREAAARSRAARPAADARLSALERRHLSARQAGSGEDEAESSSSDDSDESDDSGGSPGLNAAAWARRSSDDDDEGGAEEQARRQAARGVLNGALQAAYAQAPAGPTPAPLPPPAEDEPPAFAPPDVVSAACARALAAERAAAAPKRARAATPPPAKRPRLAPPPTAPGSGFGFALEPVVPSAPRGVRLVDLGGIEPCLSAIRELILCPLAHPELYSWLGVAPPRGVLLAGPSGVGKTSLAHAIANEASVPFFCIAAPEVVSGMSGESEARLRQLFAAARAAAPSIVFIDEVDAIAPKREGAQREMERRIVAQLLACMDSLGDESGEPGEGEERQVRGHVIVIGATNRPDALDAALRRAGRFDREIAMGVPDEKSRAHILQAQAASIRLDGGIDFARLARLTPGYVGADLGALTKEAAALAVARCLASLEAGPQPQLSAEPLTASQLAGLAICMGDYEAALPRVQPSAVREGFATCPAVSWDDVGALDDVREQLAYAITLPIAHPGRFAALGLGRAMGVLLYGVRPNRILSSHFSRLSPSRPAAARRCSRAPPPPTRAATSSASRGPSCSTSLWVSLSEPCAPSSPAQQPPRPACSSSTSWTRSRRAGAATAAPPQLPSAL